MKSTTLLIGALVAGGLTVLGLGLRSLGGPAAAADASGMKVFPDLMDGVNDVASVEVVSNEASFRVERDDRAWGLSTKGGYPVDLGQVSQLILGLAELETIEAKTSDPTRYERLGVQDPGDAGSISKLVTLRDAGGDTVASLIVGDVRSSSGLSSLYVRRNGEAQSWLAKGTVAVPTDAGALLDKKILELQRDEVLATETVHPDGEAVLVSKDERADSTFVVRDIPEGRELRFESVGNGMGSALEYLNLEDVMPASDFEADDLEPVRTSYWTWDGLRIDVAVYEKNEKVYATLRARYDEDGAPVAKLGPAASGEDEGAEAGDESSEAEAAVVQSSPEEVRARATELNDRLEPWVFEIATYAKNNFTKHMEDMVKPIEVEEPAAPELPADLPAVEGGAEEAPLIEDLLEDPEAAPVPVEEPADLPTEVPAELPADGDAPAPETPAEDAPAPADPPGDGDGR